MPRTPPLHFLALSALLATANPLLAHEAPLPLGDGKISSRPEVGFVYSCQQRFDPDAPGAHRPGEWIAGKSWYPSLKPKVEGEIFWPNARIAVAVEGSERVVRANSLPVHATGEYPVRAGSEAYSFDRNPNSVGARTVLLRLPAEPGRAAQPSCVPMGMIGFAVSGVAIYNALDGGGRDAPAHEIQDLCNGHPEFSGQYHYHNLSPCLAASDSDAPVGWMLDGFPILGPVNSFGKRYTNADLDACHGRIGPVRIEGELREMYHYRFTDEYPYSIGCFVGTPIASAMVGPPPPRPRNGRRGRTGM